MTNLGAVHVIRDVDGIAHIRADDRAGAFYGQGYACAIDRLWQMEFDRRKAMGTLAEILGPAAVGADTYHRRLAVADSARRDMAHLDAETVAMLAAYADGVNAAINAMAADPTLIPMEFGLLDAPLPAAWSGWHSVAIYKVRHLWMGTFEIKLWRSGLVAAVGAAVTQSLWPTGPGTVIDPAEAMAEHPIVAEAMAAIDDDLVDLLETLAVLGDVGASNNLVISGANTATGFPILAGDPHRAIDLPNCYWQNHLRWGTPEDSDHGDVIGLSFAGVPAFPHFGHNASLAWCITHGMADDHDLFIDRLRPTPGGPGYEYRRDQQWHPAVTRTETMGVAGGDDVAVTVIETGNGYVIAGPPDPADGGSDNPVLTMRWTATDAPDTTLNCLLPQLLAPSVDALDATFHDWVLPGNNVLAADRSGAIGYRFRGRLAVRPPGNGWTAVDGTTSANAWTGFVPDADLLRVRDPDRGFMVTANSQVSVTGPYISHDWAHPARANRLTARLGASSGWTAEQVGALLGDTHSAVGMQLAARVGAVATADATPTAAQAVRTAQTLLATWDGHMDPASAAALLVGQIRADLLPVLTLALGLDGVTGVPGVGYTTAQARRALHLRIGFVIAAPAVVTDPMIVTAVAAAMAALTERFGPDPSTWRWGDAHTARFHHPLALLRPDLADRLPTPAAVSLGGDNECVWASGTTPPSLAAVTSPVARYVFDLADWERSGWIVPHGVDGDLRRPHGHDQLVDWAGVALRPMRYATEVVDEATISVTELPRS